jgi:dihydroxy-acid dehydratase
MADLHRAGGIPSLLNYLLAHTVVIDGTQLTVTGRTLAENVADTAKLFLVVPGPDTTLVRPLANLIQREGHIGILRGNLAPGSAVAKITGAEGVRFDGTAQCFDDENSVYPALAAGDIKPGWYSFLGTKAPKVPPGMPEVQ